MGRRRACLQRDVLEVVNVEENGEAGYELLQAALYDTDLVLPCSPDCRPPGSRLMSIRGAEVIGTAISSRCRDRSYWVWVAARILWERKRCHTTPLSSSGG